MSFNYETGLPPETTTRANEKGKDRDDCKMMEKREINSLVVKIIRVSRPVSWKKALSVPYYRFIVVEFWKGQFHGVAGCVRLKTRVCSVVRSGAGGTRLHAIGIVDQATLRAPLPPL